MTAIAAWSSGCGGGGPDGGETDPEGSDDATVTSEATVTATGQTNPSSGSSTDDSSSTTAGDESSSSETGHPDDDGGEWCGNASTGRYEIASYVGRVPFGPDHGAPRVFAGWMTEMDELEVTSYDRAGATWEESIVVLENVQLDTLDDFPHGAADGLGNAIIAAGLADAASRLVVVRYDASTSEWLTEELPGPSERMAIEALLMSPSGHAVLLVNDSVPDTYEEVAVLYFYDPATASWSEPTISAPSIGWLRVAAHDPESGDALVVEQAFESGELVVHMHDAASGTLASDVLDLDGRPNALVPLGSGEYLLVTAIGEFGRSGSVIASHFDGTQWGEPEVLASGSDQSGIDAIGSVDGRAVVHWTDLIRGAFLRAFDREGGWGELLTANPSEPQAFLSWSTSRAALDDEGMIMVWSASGDDGPIRTYARRSDGVELEDVVELDPMQAVGATRIETVTSLGVDRARAVWSRGSIDFGAESYAYACHTPNSGWSEPTSVPGSSEALTPMANGEFMVLDAVDSDNAYIEYFAAR